jgi:hypothetical protein
MKLWHNRNVLAGAMFMVFGAAFFIAAMEYSLGTAARMGPGYFPRLLGGVLFVLGVVVLVDGLREVKKGMVDHIGWHIMPALYVLGAVFAFGLLLPRAGLFVASATMILIASLAAHDKKWKEVIISAIVLASFCALAFVKGLGLQMKLFPWS